MKETKAVSGGLKYDAGKPSISLIDKTALFELAKVLDYGAKKYARFNWKKGIQWSRTIDAAYRHLAAFNDGEDTDPETGLLHVAHLMCNAMFLINFYYTHKELDDRDGKTCPVSPEQATSSARPMQELLR